MNLLNEKADRPDGVSKGVARDREFRAEETAAGQFVKLIRKYGILVLSTSLLGLGAGILWNRLAIRLFTATAEIKLTTDSSNQFRLEQATGQVDEGISSKVETETEVLKSTGLAFEVIRTLRLAQEPSFITKPQGRQFDLIRNDDRQALIATLLSDINVVRVGRTSILEIRVTTRNPSLSASICNQLIDSYKIHTFEDNYSETKEVSSWLQGQLGELRSNLQNSQSRLAGMQKQIGLVGLDQTQSTLLARLQALNVALTQSETSRLLQEAKVRVLQGASPEIVDVLTTDPVLATLSARRATLKSDIAELSSLYGRQNPRRITVEAELAEVEQAIRLEEKTALSRAEKELESDTQGTVALQRELDKAKESAFSSNSAAVEYSLARQQFEADRALYQGLEQRLQEAGLLAGLHSSSVRVIEKADIPLSPSSPRSRFNLAAALMAGFLLGSVSALVHTLLDTKIRTTQDIEQILDLPLLGMLPAVPTAQLRPEAFMQQALKGATTGWSQIAESYRTVRSAILLSQAGGPPQVLLVTSARPAEGKSSVACLEAITLALGGSKVLLIDADLRRPTVAAKFNLRPGKGLSNVLSSESKFEDVVNRIAAVPTLHVLTSGPTPPMPAELLSSKRMEDLLVALRKEFEFILIDTPPLLTVTDAAVLSRSIDGILLVIRYGVATKSSVIHSLAILDRIGANTLGGILNSVSVRSVEYSDYYKGGVGYYNKPQEQTQENAAAE